ncbi:hypothetical protein PHET_10025 [Paragonimus heterotremus]|uniref:Uncharacterized protein n=1 Tax=Paragonimus heterotremus TaxID=100268 RepID=A0A8J4SSE0_9TREM|nr:hypothetical protein PHET_10025 [Paragonimus heterotremus]
MHRKIRLPVDVIRPARRLPSVRNKCMEKQSNHRHGVTNRTLSSDQFVLAKDYRDGVKKWTAGRILRRTGRVTSDMEMQPSVWVRRANQLRPSFQPMTVPSSRVILLNILLDTFELHRDVSAVAANPEAHPSSIYTFRRWTDRSRRQVVHMHVNPRQRSYEQ